MAIPLRFRANGTFTIVQFADIHWHNGEPLDRQTAALMGEILDAEMPDLVVLDGDVIDGSQCQDPAASWRQAVAPIVERHYPWAAVFGNHDDEGALDRAALMAVQQSLPYCLSQPGPDHIAGVGNYALRIDAAASDDAAATLYFIDSNSYAPTTLDGYAWIRRDQIGWYVETAHAFHQADGGVTLPALAFFHIPLPEYNEVWDDHACRGHKLEPICCPLINSGFFAALHEVGDVVGTFVGHDHLNDFEGDLYGIRLCFGRGTGFNTYGQENFKRGARVIRLEEGERSFVTWLRLEGGEVIREQPLHESEVKRSDRAAEV